MPYLVGYITPQDYGAVGNGTTDDTAAIQAALNAAASGQTVYLPVATYATSAPLIVPPCVELLSDTRTFWFPSEGGPVNGVLAPAAKIRPLASFSGAAVIQVQDMSTGGYTAASGNTTIANVTIDGTNLTGTVDGFRTYGSVMGLTIRNCAVMKVTGNGFNTVFHSGSGEGYGLLDQVDMRGFIAYACGGDGIHLSGTADSTFEACHVVACTGNAWYVNNCGNSRFIGCKAEWSAIGWNITYPTGTGSTCRNTFVGCSTDNNTGDGWYITGTQTGGYLLMTGCDMHADGHGAGATAASIHVSGAKFPVLIDNCGVYLGVTTTPGTYGPAYGLNTDTTPTLVNVSNSFFQGATAGWHTDATGTVTAGVGVFVSNGGTDVAPSAASYQSATTGAITTGTIFSGSINTFGTLTVASGNPTYLGTNLTVGATSGLGDNGSKEIQLANAATVPTTNPTGGSAIYGVNGTPYNRDPNGAVRPLVAGPQAVAATPGSLAETIQRYSVTTSSAPVSGTLYVQQIYLPAGTSVGHVGFATGTTAASGPTHWWAAVLDSTYKQQAHSADQLTAAIAASTWFNLAMATPYTTTYSGVYYLALVIATSTTQPTILQSGTTPAAQFITGTGAPTPLINGASTASLTAPGTDGTTTYAAPTAASAPFYLYCS